MHEPARHLFDRKPRGRNRFSWGRSRQADGGCVEYRIFRRSEAGKLYADFRVFRRTVMRADIALALWGMRIALRDRVDAVDLAALGIEVAA